MWSLNGEEICISNYFTDGLAMFLPKISPSSCALDAIALAPSKISFLQSSHVSVLH